MPNMPILGTSRNKKVCPHSYLGTLGARVPNAGMANNLKSLRNDKGWSQEVLALKMGTSRDQLAKLEAGSRRLSDVWIARAAKALEVDPGKLVSEEGPNRVRLEGLVGAGGEIDANLSQAYGGDVAEIELDIPIPSGIRAFEVWGNSMLPKYDPGDVLLVQRAADPIDLVLGRVALVLTEDNKRFLKRVLKGSEPGLFDLESFNAPTMKNLRILEAGLIYVAVPADQVRRVGSEKEINRRYRKKRAA